MKAKALLYAPPAYWRLTADQRRQRCNGCGTKGLCGYLVPDHLLGLPIGEACNIHDFMYEVGETLADKQEADRVFKNNMLRLVGAVQISKAWPINRLQLAVMRRRADLAEVYFGFVDKWGGPAFWDGKNQAATLGLVMA